MMPEYATTTHWKSGPIRTLEEVRAILAKRGIVMSKEAVRKAERRALSKIRDEWERLEKLSTNKEGVANG
jgi:transposase-like protein